MPFPPAVAPPKRMVPAGRGAAGAASMTVGEPVAGVVPALTEPIAARYYSSPGSGEEVPAWARFGVAVVLARTPPPRRPPPAPRRARRRRRLPRRRRLRPRARTSLAE